MKEKKEIKEMEMETVTAGLTVMAINLMGQRLLTIRVN